MHPGVGKDSIRRSFILYRFSSDAVRIYKKMIARAKTRAFRIFQFTELNCPNRSVRCNGDGNRSSIERREDETRAGPPEASVRV